MKKNDPQVLVVGAGPVGLYAAARLHELGVSVTVAEAGRQPTASSYALALHAQSLQLLDRIGLATPLLERGHTVDRVGFYDSEARRAVVTLDQQELDFDRVLVLPQAELESHLKGHLTICGVPVLWSHRVSELEVAPDWVQVRIERLVADSIGYDPDDAIWVVDDEITLRPRFVLGADGHRSMVRRWLRSRLQERLPSQLFAVFECVADGAGEVSETKVVLTGDLSAVCWPLGGDRCRWGFQVSKDWQGPMPFREKRRSVQSAQDEAFPHVPEHRLEELLRLRAPWWKHPVRDVTASALIRFDRRVVDRFGRDRMWLAGDAAHLCGPIGVHSMNIGLGEAAEVVDLIAAGLDPAQTTEPLDRYGRNRYSAWATYFDLVADPAAGAPVETSWIAAHRHQIAASLPAGGHHLETLLAAVQSTGG